MPMHSRSVRRRAMWFWAAATCLTPLGAGAALAEDAAPAPAPTPADAAPSGPAPSGGLGDIVVTATRRAESLQKVPISLQALSADKLAERQVSNFADYAALLPSVSFATLGPGRSEVYFRGISVSGGALPTAGTYLDDIPMTTAGRMPEIHVYDVERVEALSGPQGTLFGASSLSGTLRIITNKPKLDTWEGGYDIQGNKYGPGDAGGMFEGYLNIPIGHTAALRLMGFYQHDGGYIDNTHATHNYALGFGDGVTRYTIDNKNQVKKNYNPVTEYGGRAALAVQVADDWMITPSITYQYLDAKGSFNYDPRVGDLEVHDFNPTWDKDSWYQAALAIQGQIAGFDVISSTGYFHRRIKNANDYTYYTVHYDSLGPGYENYLYFKDKNGNTVDPTQQYYGDYTQRKFTQEVRVSVPKSWPFALTAGVFYQWQKNNDNEDYYIAGLSQDYLGLAYDEGQLVSAPVIRRDAFYLVELDETYKDFALFAEGTYEILPRLKLTGGIRYFTANNRVYGFAGTSASVPDSCTIPFTGPRLSCVNENVPYSQSGETHKASLAFQVTPQKMVYFTYSTGFRPGGGNRIAPDHPYKADTLTNYELGLKTQWGRNFRLNAAIYYEQWSGIQYLVVPQGYQGAGLTVNAGDARVYGVEADFDWKVAPRLTLSGSGAYNDAALSTNFCDLVSRSDLSLIPNCSTAETTAATKGTRLPRQPRFKMQASARYDFPLGHYDAYLQGVVNHQSSSTSDLDTTNDALLGDTPGFVSFDFSAGVRRAKWNAEVFIQNAFDERGQLSKNTFCSIQYCSGSSRTYPIKPQFFGVKFGQKF